MLVRVDDRYGLIDTTGAFLIDATLEWLDQFENGFAIADPGGGLGKGVIDTIGRWVVKPGEFAKIDDQSRSYFTVCVGDCVATTKTHGVIKLRDTTWEQVFPCKFEQTGVTNGYAWAATYRKEGYKMHFDSLFVVDPDGGLHSFDCEKSGLITYKELARARYSMSEQAAELDTRILPG
ncbi:MAG: WG repeat-containing protein [bacterium]|nr:WG repeat-containing protein [bacterium]